MRILINERLSEHRYKTPEGYLVCTDAILARTGKQTYKRGEVFGQDCRDSDAEIEVDRTEKEVFSDATLASFENKPLTVEHPDENVNVDNHSQYAVGFVRDVKRNNVDGQDVMTGTLVITDKQTIEEIENGEHTDLSCGYDCDIADEKHPQQRNIRGNHVALCQQGRAGIARIIDSVDDGKKLFTIHYKKIDKPVIIRSAQLYANDRNEAIRQFLNEHEDVIIDKVEVKDSVDDALVEIPSNILGKFEDMLTMKHIHIDNKGKTMFGHIHYQVSSYEDWRSFTRALEEIDAKMEAMNVPMTFNAGKGYDKCTAGIDLDKMQTRDSIKDFDQQYAREIQELENDVKKANDVWKLVHNRSASDIFTHLGYKKDGQETFYKKNGAYTKVIKFYDFDDLRLYVLKDDKIPSGWTITRTKWYDSIKDDSIKDNDKYEIEKLLSSISKAYSNDPGIEFVKRKLYENGFRDVSIEKVEGWIPNRNVPGEYSKTYWLKIRNKKEEGYVKAVCILYADQDAWKVKEIVSYVTGISKDSVNDVDPREGESKEDFISRFMEKTKEEYPDEKQRLAVAYSYWDKNKVMKEKGKDSEVKDVDWDFLHKIREYDMKQISNAAKRANLYRRIFEFDNSMNISYSLIESRLSTSEKQKLLKALAIKDAIKDDSKHYAVYADGTMESNSRALYWRRSGKPKYSYLGEADLFTSDEADKICQQRGSYFWRKRYTDRVGDSLKKFEVHQKDSKGIEHIYIVKANSLADAIKKIK